LARDWNSGAANCGTDFDHCWPVYIVGRVDGAREHRYEMVSGDLPPYKYAVEGGERIRHVRGSSWGVIGFYGARARAPR